MRRFMRGFPVKCVIHHDCAMQSTQGRVRGTAHCQRSFDAHLPTCCSGHAGDRPDCRGADIAKFENAMISLDVWSLIAKRLLKDLR